MNTDIGRLISSELGWRQRELAFDAGVTRGVTGAIQVDERMQTNLGGVYAAGDCAEAMHLVTRRPTYLPLGTTAPGGWTRCR